MLVCNGAPQNVYGLGPRKAIIRPCTGHDGTFLCCSGHDTIR